jgi:hypothetical protein
MLSLLFSPFLNSVQHTTFSNNNKSYNGLGICHVTTAYFQTVFIHANQLFIQFAET